MIGKGSTVQTQGWATQAMGPCTHIGKGPGGGVGYCLGGDANADAAPKYPGD